MKEPEASVVSVAVRRDVGAEPIYGCACGIELNMRLPVGESRPGYFAGKGGCLNKC